MPLSPGSLQSSPISYHSQSFRTLFSSFSSRSFLGTGSSTHLQLHVGRAVDSISKLDLGLDLVADSVPQLRWHLPFTQCQSFIWIFDVGSASDLHLNRDVDSTSNIHLHLVFGSISKLQLKIAFVVNSTSKLHFGP